MDLIIEVDSCFQDEKMISVISDQECDTMEHDIEINFSYLEII